jgi:hypothetical protein
MDITAFELARKIEAALVFGDTAGALALASELVAHHEAAVEAEAEAWAEKNVTAVL